MKSCLGCVDKIQGFYWHWSYNSTTLTDKLSLSKLSNFRMNATFKPCSINLIRPYASNGAMRTDQLIWYLVCLGVRVSIGRYKETRGTVLPQAAWQAQVKSRGGGIFRWFWPELEDCRENGLSHNKGTKPVQNRMVNYLVWKSSYFNDLKIFRKCTHLIVVILRGLTEMDELYILLHIL